MALTCEHCFSLQLWLQLVNSPSPDSPTHTKRHPPGGGRSRIDEEEDACLAAAARVAEAVVGVGGWGESDGVREGGHGGGGGRPSAVSAAAVQAVAAQNAAGMIVFLSIIVFLNNSVPLDNNSVAL